MRKEERRKRKEERRNAKDEQILRRRKIKEVPHELFTLQLSLAEETLFLYEKERMNGLGTAPFLRKRKYGEV